MVIFLRGDLGAGKTCLARHFIQAMGFDGVVKSPTYTLVEPYALTDGRTVYHFDLYRLAEPEELDYIGGRDYFTGDAICLVEWPDRAEGFLPPGDLVCELEHAVQGRRLRLGATSAKGKELMLQVFSDESL